ncbi:MAG: DUF4250 domain-containing protein [Leptotrichiaceae bacterium]|jgi:hypothetical protein|nr:DUF4250 domain-containing protein [Leptotrichiaceae bacterium]MBP6281316.1 DUF4250 domain-containing protein [Leptotrichiaceae bacterium]MBP7100483.1 DUF4250 domain-containing protein [Leptotrichiaceae bacterium]MBP7739678.1 DUF4250 domain-containing protein [Leptotrichiaceae bacterium]MBP9630101.1 DUF4250 domain-containing protein [Leptotrichiaceae bacterium]
MFNFQSGDINIVLSMLNMKLRDEFSDLDDLVKTLSVNKEELLKRMNDNGYYYSEGNNQFKRK